jgi:hypothetical protein
MAYYAYKSVVYRGDFEAAIDPYLASISPDFTRKDYDGDANYDGDAWYVVGFLLDEKDKRIAELEAEVAALKAK